MLLAIMTHKVPCRSNGTGSNSVVCIRCLYDSSEVCQTQRARMRRADTTTYTGDGI